MYQQLYIYTAPDRRSFRFISETVAIDDFPDDCYTGSLWTIQLLDQPLPGRFVVVDIPSICQIKKKAMDQVPRIETFLAPIADRWLYGDPEFPFLRAA